MRSLGGSEGSGGSGLIPKFRDMTAAEIGKLMPDRPVLVDVRGIVDPVEARTAGIDYRRL